MSLVQGQVARARCRLGWTDFPFVPLYQKCLIFYVHLPDKTKNSSSSEYAHAGRVQGHVAIV